MKQNLVSSKTENVPELKPKDTLAKDLRPIRLAIDIAEALLSRGVSTRDVVTNSLDVTERYCKRRVHFDISSNIITASQYRGDSLEPLTLMSTVSYQASNNMIVQEVQQLVRDIVKGLPFNQANERLKQIKKQSPHYPEWLRMVANATMATGFVMFYTTNWASLLMTFLAACMLDRLMYWLGNRRIPPLFVQAAVAFGAVVLATTVGELGQAGVGFFRLVDPTAITVGGVIMLVAGLMLAATAQDAIDEYYMTASARLVKTMMLTIGILIGVIFGLSLVGEISDIWINPSTELSGTGFIAQCISAFVAAMAWATYTQSSKAAIFWAGVIGVAGFVTYSLLGGIGTVFSSGIAGFVIGFMATIAARLWKTPDIAIVNAAVLALLPGYMLYRGLMHFTGDVTQATYLQGALITTTAVSIGLAITAGAAFGHFVGRPFRPHFLRVHEYVPQVILSVRRSGKFRRVGHKAK